jgi:hypothetical protein
MIVKYLIAQQRLAFGDNEQAKTGFYWQAEVDDPWIGPFETLEEASTDGKQCCFGVIWAHCRNNSRTLGGAHLPRSDISSLTASPVSAAPPPWKAAQLQLPMRKTVAFAAALGGEMMMADDATPDHALDAFRSRWISPAQAQQVAVQNTYHQNLASSWSKAISPMFALQH